MRYWVAKVNPQGEGGVTPRECSIRDILDLLVEMNCDIAQGFAIGRPMSLESLTRRLTSDRKRGAA